MSHVGEDEGRVVEPRDLLEEHRLLGLGRWGAYPRRDGVVAVNSGSRLLLAWRGPGRITLEFGPNARPDAAHVYVHQPGGSRELYSLGEHGTSVRLERRSMASSEVHECAIVVKDVDEHLNRWQPPFDAAVWLRSVRVSGRAFLVRPRVPAGPSMEFLGDSITQGVRTVSCLLGPQGSDGAASFAYLVAHAFDAPARQVGFGGQGLLVPGNGRVPPAPDTLAWNFAGSPVDARFAPEVVVVALGTNDSQSGPTLTRAYRDYLSGVRRLFPRARVVGVIPAARDHDTWLRAAVDELGDRRITLVSARDRLGPADYTDGTHPNRVGHRKLAQVLVTHISTITGHPVVRAL